MVNAGSRLISPCSEKPRKCRTLHLQQIYKNEVSSQMRFQWFIEHNHLHYGDTYRSSKCTSHRAAGANSIDTSVVHGCGHAQQDCVARMRSREDLSRYTATGAVRSSRGMHACTHAHMTHCQDGTMGCKINLSLFSAVAGVKHSP